jgi:CBS domain-containing protein
MTVQHILDRKGSNVATLPPDATIATAAKLLRQKKIGAIVVSPDGKKIAGILSERDIAHGLDEHGADLAGLTVQQLMTAKTLTCTPVDSVEAVMQLMTDHRVRHLPVVRNGSLAGIVSIGDIVKNRLEHLQHETEALQDYIAGRA